MVNPYNNENSESRPASWAGQPAGYEVVDDIEGADQPGALQYLGRMWRHRWLILAIFIPCLAASVYVARLAGPTFIATARLRLGVQTPKVAPFQPAEDRTDARIENLVQTQVNIFQNRTIAAQVVDQLGYKPEPSYWAGLKARISTKLFGRYGPAIIDRQTAREQAIDAFMMGLTVVPIAETQIFEARYSSQDPNFSARALNALCEAYLKNDFQTKSASYSEARRWLQEKMSEVKASLARSEEALYKYTGADGAQFMTLSDGGLQYLKEMDELRLKIAALEDEYSKRKVDRDHLEAGGLPDDAPGSAGISVVSQLRSQLATADIELEKVKQTLGPMDSSYKNAAAARARLALQFNAEKSRLLQVANLQFKQTQEQLAGLRKKYDERQKQIIALQQRLSGYNALKREADLNRETYNNLQQKWQEVGIGQSIQPADAVILQRAERPLTPIYRDRDRILLYGLLIGLCLSFGAAAIADRFDTTIKGGDEVWRLTRLETLGAIPAIPGGKAALLMHEKPGSAAADGIRTLRGSIEFMCGGHPPKTLLVTSASRGDGKTTVAANIAISLAQKGRSVLLIDADLRNGALRRVFDLNGESGLAEMLATGRTGVEEFAVSTSIPRLCAIPSGKSPANPSDLFDAEAMRHVIGSAVAHFDHVVIDSTSLCTLAEAGVLAAHVDAVIVVARPNRTPREEFMEIHRLLNVVGARVIGAVMNNSRPEPIRIRETHAPMHLDRVLHDGNGHRHKSERMAAAGPAGGYYDI